MEGKVIAITGGASGIGLSLTKLLLSRGCKVSIADISRENLESTTATVDPNQIMSTQCDVRSLSAVADWLKQTVDKFGRLDGAANLAGIAQRTDRSNQIQETDEDEWDSIIGVNLTGVMHCMKEELKLMQEGGSIVNAASIAGQMGLHNTAAYCASKHGVIGLTKVGAKENGSKGIRVNAVAPGWIDTPMLHKIQKEAGKERLDALVLNAPMARGGNASEVAKVIAFLLSDEASFVTGSVYNVDGGWMC